VLDSLGHSPTTVFKQLRQYLGEEWADKKKNQPPRTFKKENILGTVPKVPNQDNYSDCGVFVLKYVEQFCAGLPEDLTKKGVEEAIGPNWFKLEEIKTKREDIKNAIVRLGKECGSD